jgi:outer membrane protein assembly factor BamB
MKTQLNKLRLTTIALLLLLAASGTIAMLPAVTAHTPAWTVPTYAFLNCAPDPVGVGQTVFVTFWLDRVPPTANVAFGDRWENLTLKITKPDGTTQTMGPYRTDDVGGAYIQWRPDSVGTYTFQMIFPGQTMLGANPNPVTGTNNPQTVGDYYMPSQSKAVKLIVQATPIQPRPSTPLPTDYWQRPINGMNPEWTPVAGDWLMATYDQNGNCFNPATQAPESAHIVWTYPIAPGGVSGGVNNVQYPDWNYYTGLAYEAKFSGFIMYGRLYTNLPLSTSAGAGGAACIDLRTGKTLWIQNNTRVSMGQEYDYASPNQFGVIPYLWNTGNTVGPDVSKGNTALINTTYPSSYTAYDPWTGQWLFDIVNVTSGTLTFGPTGEILVYILNAQRGWIAMWNSSKCIMYYQQPGVLAGGNVWQWRPLMQRTMDWNKGLQWNTTVVANYSQTVPGSTALSYATIKRISIDDGVIFASSVGSFAIPYDWTWEIGFSTRDGSLLWAVNRTGPIDWNTLQGSPVGSGIYTEFHPETMTWTGYSLLTGNKAWGPTDPYPSAFGVYSWQARYAYGKLFAADYAGYVHCYDMTTGKKLWDYYGGNSGMETVYGGWPFNTPMAVADGKVYVVTGHAYNPPLFKGAQVYCINATSGQLIWEELGFYAYDGIAIADNTLVLYNVYDGQLVAYSSGLTKTTVSAPDLASSIGQPVLIKGTVTDQSPGQTCLGIPAAGTPAIADNNMDDWMAYLYMQQPKPTNATGVDVRLTVTDPNGNGHYLTAKSDVTGNFALSWNPPVPGLYTVKANFDGSNAYYQSEAETSFVVSQAPQAVVTTPTVAPTQNAVPTPTPVQPTSPSPSMVPPPTNAAPTTTYIAIGLAVIIIVAVAAALVLRRRK